MFISVSRARDSVIYEHLGLLGSPQTVKYEVVVPSDAPGTVKYKLFGPPGAPETVKYHVFQPPSVLETAKYVVLATFLWVFTYISVSRTPDTIIYEHLGLLGCPETLKIILKIKKRCQPMAKTHSYYLY